MAKQSDVMQAFVLGAILIGAVFFLTGGDFLGAVTQPEEPEEPTDIECTGGQTQGATLSAYDADNVGTSFTEGTNIYQKEGTPSWSTFTQGSEITGLSVGSSYRFVFGIDTSDFIDNAYGPIVDVNQLPCVFDESYALYDDEPETDLTATFYNANDDASAQTFTTGDSYTVDLTFKSDSEDYFGNPYIPEMASAKGIESPESAHSAQYPNVLVLELNASTMDAPEKVEAITTEGEKVTLDRISVPGRQSLSSGKNYYAYEAPVVGDGTVRFELSLNADDSNAPAADDTAYLYAANWYINSDTGEIAWGVETEEDAAVGTDSSDSVTLDFTS